jgi:hypothetical protein
MEPATVIELGFSDHQPQVLSALCENRTGVNRRVLKRHFGDDNIRELQCLLKRRHGREYF